MRKWWDRIFVVLIVVIAGFAVYAVWPDEPDRYFPDFLNLPSGQGLPGKIGPLELPCHTDDDPENPADNCKGMTLGLDLRGGSRTTLQADPQGQDVDIDAALNAAKQIIENRINPFGVSESQVQRAGKDRLIVELPGVSAETARDITRPAVLMFCEPLQRGTQGPQGNPIALSQQAQQVYYKPGTCEPDVDADGNVALRAPDGTIATNADGTVQRITPQYTTSALDVNSVIWTPAKGELNGAPTIMTGNFLKPDVELLFAPVTGAPYLIFNTTGDGEKVFGSLTDRMQGLPMATFLDGEPIRGRDDRVLAPTIQSQITDSGQITGLALDEAKRLRTFLNNGAFPVPLRVIQQQDIDATLGDTAVKDSVQAGLVAMGLIMAFMILYYRFPGIIASVALGIYTAIVLAIFKIGIPGTGPVTLTLAGVAAFVLSVGMAVDANILIFERTKEELRNGRSLIPAVEAGFDRAWSSIRDSNVSTMITCLILYWMGDAFASSLIKGFALTLAIGVIISLFSAITITRSFMRLATATPLRRWLWLWTDDKPEPMTGARTAPALPGTEVADA
ncbi:MAG TPA: protein translocase subunit SecD [Dehalococcoidia bacterium]|jgi:preprotein translocase subunit SecD|nr:protein translocase subunit SecD [Dehalococcoidia bacterium]